MPAAELRQEALFGLYDGAVSICGVIFGLAVHGAPASTIALAGLGGGVAAAVSMGSGEVEKSGEPVRERLDVGLAMGAATLLGSLAPVWPFLVLGRSAAAWASGACCLAVAVGIAHVKSTSRRVRGSGWRSYARSLVTFGAAVGATVLLVSLVPASA